MNTVIRKTVQSPFSLNIQRDVNWEMVMERNVILVQVDSRPSDLWHLVDILSFHEGNPFSSLIS